MGVFHPSSPFGPAHVRCLSWQNIDPKTGRDIWVTDGRRRPRPSPNTSKAVANVILIKNCSGPTNPNTGIRMWSLILLEGKCCTHFISIYLWPLRAQIESLKEALNISITWQTLRSVSTSCWTIFLFNRLLCCAITTRNIDRELETRPRQQTVDRGQLIFNATARQISSRAGHKQKRHRWEQVALLIALIHTASDNKGGLKGHPRRQRVQGIASCNNIGGKSAEAEEDSSPWRTETEALVARICCRGAQ